ncbi:hypothetical protein DTO164E3_8743 [Paecilomyces variotii]|nr:hypothetical protein DTO164E3_8743 [Paecilomyces variotii]KAJ9209002.1 hypothetical protein DTO032I3_219 [Paecilomyces variotii]KAJ9222695.1 hypothetical protein DTO169C6_4900 [Paecilomyces variotii]KAJ9247548.1 hypothetical protein DTO207G8_8014 [Paecilomyces variotii]KAJ9248672.1 hypothetical protein DTO195F2_8781 [Paecilomyces variotii]
MHKTHLGIYSSHFRTALAYKLELPPHWRVHNVFSVAHLEPAPPGNDPFDRRPQPMPPVHTEADGTEHYEIENLIDKRTRRRRRRVVTNYLVRWKGWGPRYDAWYDINDLGDAKELVQEYENEVTGHSPAPHLLAAEGWDSDFSFRGLNKGCRDLLSGKEPDKGGSRWLRTL